MKTTLVVMAAGIGSRYGAGIKQLAKMDENGYTIIDYSIYDAKEAGFDKVVFIIRPDIKKDFKEIIGDRISKIIEVDYAYQTLDLGEKYQVPSDRKKPWGTVHAVLAAKDLVDEPFLIINADDYYGKNVFKDFHKFLTDTNNQKKGKLQIAMAGYKLKNTLSDNGSVTRGVSVGNKDNKLVKIIETHEIALEKNGKISSKENLDSDLLNLETIVSMNMWATFPRFIDLCQEYFEKYLEKNKNNLEEAEYVLPEMIGEFLQEDIAQITILPTNDKWIGITYKEDLEPAQEEFKKMLINKDYPENIWK
ncbi:UDP-N-acetylglucosamine diphosphorylase/glucosamine-1-phosphate N-acetyltransferase [Anaerococcus octavius]|uniref:UDP-N-acetylglucosamine diphosphorylase/glucosamine-1-phosphate N-acetyltransferase n=1 Tax=Anaerococcus octavius TaxID=54007 RepID=A0A380WYD5_9FIRM|nr:sugar phosphate nucleotidyltransferase [Anaerococcus octavius]MDU0893839.1 sugar phosphate nucleotidyltransferase [Anaerococcus sp.]SUU93174.1 UDP-N-acetylglucosamine diphosphorylase/glucosamine-1-phosphate N-acetyltransferase [Anaerococcus octavius]